MPAEMKFSRPVGLSRTELGFIALLIALSLVLGWHGINRRARDAQERFLELAPRIASALERYAADHQGAYPRPVPPTQRPIGLGDKYIRWNSGWGIVYDVRRSSRKTFAVCLELLVPNKQVRFQRLCQFADKRKKYGQGQPIPGTQNRLWVVKKSARIDQPERPRRKTR